LGSTDADDTYDGTNSPGTVTSAVGGCITFTWDSDFSGTEEAGLLPFPLPMAAPAMLRKLDMKNYRFPPSPPTLPVMILRMVLFLQIPAKIQTTVQMKIQRPRFVLRQEKQLLLPLPHLPRKQVELVLLLLIT
jgi:hypothetical protein